MNSKSKKRLAVEVLTFFGTVTTILILWGVQKIKDNNLTELYEKKLAEMYNGVEIASTLQQKNKIFYDDIDANLRLRVPLRLREKIFKKIEEPAAEIFDFSNVMEDSVSSGNLYAQLRKNQIAELENLVEKLILKESEVEQFLARKERITQLFNVAIILVLTVCYPIRGLIFLIFWAINILKSKEGG